MILKSRILKFLPALLACIWLSLPSPVKSEEIVISAAASLTNALQSAGKNYQSSHPKVKLLFNFAASGSLLQQIAHGAPVDIFASANQAFMDRAAKEDLIRADSRHNFARNSLVLAVPADEKTGVRCIDDLGRNPMLRIAIGDPLTVPAGRYARLALQENGLWKILETKLILATSVRQVLDYLRRGEIDAGLIYSTDYMVANGSVKKVQTMDNLDPITYCIAVTRTSRNYSAGMQFIHYLLSDQGQTIMASFGFERP